MLYQSNSYYIGPDIGSRPNKLRHSPMPYDTALLAVVKASTDLLRCYLIYIKYYKIKNNFPNINMLSC